ncbi:hypothetical protein HKD37_20G055618 [Glycine soja]
MPTQTLTPSSPPPITFGCHHEPSLLATKPPQEEEHFNQSGILRIHLKDSVKNNPSIHYFVASLRVFLHFLGKPL